MERLGVLPLILPAEEAAYQIAAKPLSAKEMQCYVLNTTGVYCLKGIKSDGSIIVIACSDCSNCS